MNLSNRIYSRKVLYRLVYMYNFYKSILSKNIYLDFADKIDNIVNKWLDKIDVSDYEKYDFSKLIISDRKWVSKSFDISEYLSYFDPKNEDKFNEVVSYTSSFFVINKQEAVLDYQYLVNNMSYIIENYESIIEQIDQHLESFKFLELNSVDQSILLLWIIENKTIWTPKSVIIKECLFLASTFTSDSSTKLINAVLDKTI